MAEADQGDRRGRFRHRHAPAGHQEREGSDGHVHRGPGAPDPVLRGAERAGEHPEAAGPGHRGGKGPGREVRQAAQAAAGELSQRLPAVEGREDHRYGGGKRVRDAAVHVSVPGGDLRKGRVVVRGVDLQEGVLFCKFTQILYYS